MYLKMLVIVFIILSSFSIALAAPVEVSITPDFQNVEIGQDLIINISIDPNNNPITGAQFNLLFNSSVLEIDSINEDNLFRQNGSDTAFNSGVLNNSDGTLINVWGLITMPGANVTSKGTLVTIKMITLEAGISPLKVKNVIISDTYGRSVQVHSINGTVEVIE